MIVSSKIIGEIYQDAGPERTLRGHIYYENKRVELETINYTDIENFRITAKIYGSKTYSTQLSAYNGEITSYHCSCEDFEKNNMACKHIVASLLEFSENKDYETRIKKSMATSLRSLDERKNKGFKQILNSFYNDELNSLDEVTENNQYGEKIKIIPQVMYDRYLNQIKVEFKIGNKQLYKLKNLSEFYDNIKNNSIYRYGSKLEFKHNMEVFEEKSKPIVDFILNYSEMIKYVNEAAKNSYRYYGKPLKEDEIILNEKAFDELFEILSGEEVDFTTEYIQFDTKFIPDNPDVNFILKKNKKNEYVLESSIGDKKYKIIEGKEYKYVLIENCLYRCDKKFSQSVLKLLELFRKNGMEDITLNKEDLQAFFAIIKPKLNNHFLIKNIEDSELEKYIPKKLGVKAYFDFNEDDYVIAKVMFCYDGYEFNPLEDKNVTIPRDIISENESLNLFRKSGFMLDEQNKEFILPNEERIYNFLLNDIQEYMKKFEVLVTDNFKSKDIRQPKIGTIGVKVENNLLNIDLNGLDFDLKELEEIMKKYSVSKKYHRLKDGSFLNLAENEDIEFIEKFIGGMDINYSDLEKGEIKLPINRSLYLDRLLDGTSNIGVSKDSEYKNIVKNLSKNTKDTIEKIPENLENTLRDYQKTGYNWLKNIDQYRMGGILADDMGLGKTIQMLSVIVSYIKETPKEEIKPSIVVAPSSLTLNWKSEALKFATDLQVLVISGNAIQRKEQIEDINSYDLIITSYDLLRRDYELYKEKNINFRYMIADEAQYIKNSNTQNAKSIKSINAETRYALTGTPIENSLAELWSIFDYIMPGYLFDYKRFKANYEMPIVKDNNERALKRLKLMIEPFILRRTKKEVLKELPDKTVTVLNNEMTSEQEKIHAAYIVQAKQEISNAIDMNGFEKSQIKILSALTRLRQICCHPELFIENYNGGSGKLEQCMQIVEDGINSGHKILLFSVYTSMLGIIERSLKEKNVRYLKLTGETKVSDRIDLVNEFNENSDIKVFLISLKAGGTGLNLTGADMVIHYDPWWNISSENQATDRAHRIGQKNNVQVYKLITKNSIEERIYELQQKKSKLIDNMLDTKTSFISKLSKDDIMALFRD